MYALLTNIDGKYSPASVTNSIEHIRKQLIEKGFISSKTLIVEHYEDRLSGYGSFDSVIFGPGGSPSWESITIDKASERFGCDCQELLDKSLKINDYLTSSKGFTRRYARLQPIAGLRITPCWLGATK